eukprot:1319211-Amorphochlora_amoeboformis.AAC.1
MEELPHFIKRLQIPSMYDPNNVTSAERAEASTKAESIFLCSVAAFVRDPTWGCFGIGLSSSC